MTDVEVARYALRTFDLEYDWYHEACRAMYAYDHERLYQYPYALLGPIGRAGGGVWQDGTCTAQCLRGTYKIGMWEAAKGKAFLPALPGHEAPHMACTCGVYGALDFTCLYSQYGHEMKRITAVIAAEGKTVIGTRGLRTQYARVVAWCAGNDLYGEIAKEQFKDAQQFTVKGGELFDTIAEMLNAYHLPVDTGAAGKEGGGYGWWA